MNSYFLIILFRLCSFSDSTICTFNDYALEQALKYGIELKYFSNEVDSYTVWLMADEDFLIKNDSLSVDKKKFIIKRKSEKVNEDIPIIHLFEPELNESKKGFIKFLYCKKYEKNIFRVKFLSYTRGRTTGYIEFKCNEQNGIEIIDSKCEISNE